MDIKNLKRGQRVLVRAHVAPVEGPGIVLDLYPEASAVKVLMCDPDDEKQESITVRASEVIKDLPL